MQIPINHLILEWARKTSGRSIEDVAKTLKKSESVIESWESGKNYPTYSQLEKLSYKIYKRPIAIFFLPNPPDEPELNAEFRTIPDIEIDKFHPDTISIIKNAKAFQLHLYEINENKNPAEKPIFNHLSLTQNVNIENFVNDTRSFLDIDLTIQKGWRSSEIAFKEWRNIFENFGIFTFKAPMKQNDISGFCLHDDTFPIIIINNKNTFTRQIFTLFHELSHILFGLMYFLTLFNQIFCQISRFILPKF